VLTIASCIDIQQNSYISLTVSNLSGQIPVSMQKPDLDLQNNFRYSGTGVALIMIDAYNYQLQDKQGNAINFQVNNFEFNLSTVFGGYNHFVKANMNHGVMGSFNLQGQNGPVGSVAIQCELDANYQDTIEGGTVSFSFVDCFFTDAGKVFCHANMNVPIQNQCPALDNAKIRNVSLDISAGNGSATWYLRFYSARILI
jgi:hypothetical protein